MKKLYLFLLVYSSKVVIPTEVIQPMLKSRVNEEDNIENHFIDLILIEEKRRK